jgi:hypothetical protein
MDHAILAAWGNDIFFTNFDRDEVLGFPNPVNLKEVISTGCMKGASLIRLPMALKFTPAATLPENKDGDFFVLRKDATMTAYSVGCYATFFNPKNIFHPNGTLFVNIHDGRAEKGFEELTVSHDCAYYAHSVNYWAKRYSLHDVETGPWQCPIKNDSSWLWMY